MVLSPPVRAEDSTEHWQPLGRGLGKHVKECKRKAMEAWLLKPSHFRVFKDNKLKASQRPSPWLRHRGPGGPYW